MTFERDIERLLDAWLEDGPTVVSDRAMDVVGHRIDRQRQRPAWRFPHSPRRVDLDMGAVVFVGAIVLTALVGLNLAGGFRPPQTGVPGPTPSPAVTATPAASPPGAASPRPTASAAAPLGPGLVVFENWHHPALRLYTRLEYLSPDLRGLELLPEVRGLQEAPAWSPDGARLAFAGFNFGDGVSREFIYETDAKGTTPRLVSTNCEPPDCLEEWDPAYSPDGSRLAYVRQSGATRGDTTSSVVAIRDLTTGTVVELTSTRKTSPQTEVRHPSWSPDGQNLVFDVVTRGTAGIATGSSIYVVTSDGTGLRRLTPPDMTAGDASWSPDGSLVLLDSMPLHVFANPRGFDTRNEHLYTIATDGSGLHQVDSAGNSGEASWASDGTTILYTGDAGLKVMNRDGSNDRLVARFSECCRWYPVQQPTP